MYVPFFLAPWLLGSLQLRKNRFSVQSGLRLAFTKTEKERQKKTVQLNIYKQIITWELLLDLLLAVVYFCLKLDFYFTKSCSNHLTF